MPIEHFKRLTMRFDRYSNFIFNTSISNIISIEYQSIWLVCERENEMQLLHEMIDVLLQTFDLFPEEKEYSVNYKLCHNMNECQLTYETNGWSYYAQNDQCRSSHQQSVIDRLMDHLSLRSRVSL